MDDFGKLNFAVSLNPTSAFPLDARTQFDSYDEAALAASTAGPIGSTDTVYHYGMTLTVNEGGAVKKYVIQPDKTLVKLSTMDDVPKMQDISWEDYKALAEAGGVEENTYYMIVGDDP